jgi:hypothetical protein
VDALALESELTLDDQGNQAPPTVPPGAPFVKAWRVRNIGTCVWDGTYALVLADGEAMGGQAVAVTGTVPAGASHDLSQQFIAPASAGLHHGLWQMTSGAGQAFGERLDVTIDVSAGPTVTPVPSPTAVPDIQFGASPTSVVAGEQVTFNWVVQNASSQYFYRQGSNWRQFPVGPTGSRVAWPAQTTTYELRAIMLDGTTQLQQIVISVSPAPGAPDITKFILNPPAEVVLGGCVDLSWVVAQPVDGVSLFRGDALLLQGAQAQGRAKDCPPQAGTVTYRLEAVGPDGTGRAARDLNVVAPNPTATAVPSGDPTPAPAPQIVGFGAWPKSLPAGYCLTIQWQVQNATRVRLTRGTGVILDQAPLAGTTTDCPITPGNMVYRLEAVNEASQSVFSENVVTVTAR